MDYKLEVAVIPVTEADRAKDFYKMLGWRLDADFVITPEFRVIQFTPPGSAASIHFGSGVTTAPPGSANVWLVVTDVEAAGGAGRQHRVEPGKVAPLPPRAVGLQRGVDGAVEGPGNPGQGGGQVRARVDVDLEVGVEEAERDAGRTAAQEVLRQAGQPGELTTGRRPGVGEPELHEDGQLGLAAHGGDDRGLGRAAGRGG